MADTKISALTDGNPAQAGDALPIARSGSNFKITPASILAYGTSPVAGTTGTFSATLAVTGVATLTAQPILSALTASSAVATDSVKGLVSVTNTGTGNNVLATSPTLVTPALGTPTALVGTNITGTAAGLTAGNVTTNANLTGGVTSVGNAATVVTNANLTGGVTSVGNAATVVTNANLTGGVTSVGNAATVVTNANLTGGVTSVGNAATVVTNANLTGAVVSVGNAATLGSFTSAARATALTDETGSGAAVFATSPALVTPALGTPTSGALDSCTVGGLSIGYRIIPQNNQSAAYTLVLGDSGYQIYHPGADTTARTWTIPANSSVAYPIGTTITFINDTSAGVVTISITTDTMVLAGAGTTGSRTLAASGIATAVKMTSTRWMINGTGLT